MKKEVFLSAIMLVVTLTVTADEYIDLVIDFEENLRPDIVLERFVSQSPASLLAIPGWGLKNYEFVKKVRKRMEERDARQGKRYCLI